MLVLGCDLWKQFGVSGTRLFSQDVCANGIKLIQFDFGKGENGIIIFKRRPADGFKRTIIDYSNYTFTKTANPKVKLNVLVWNLILFRELLTVLGHDKRFDRV